MGGNHYHISRFGAKSRLDHMKQQASGCTFSFPRPFFFWKVSQSLKIKLCVLDMVFENKGFILAGEGFGGGLWE